MSSKSTARPSGPAANGTAHSLTTPPAVRDPHVVIPSAVYSIAQLNAALDLKPGTLPREFRKKRLRYAKRAGRVWVLGQWVLDWLAGGQVTR
jgi:hypothetical protein